MKRDPTRHELEPGVWLDGRRALWLAEERLLVIADLHLGYAWAHRHSGQMLPITAAEDTTQRIVELAESYGPREIVLLGDVVHRAVSVPALKTELCHFFEEIGAGANLRLIVGNHDRHLARLLDECGIQAELHADLTRGNFLLVHGDNLSPDSPAIQQHQSHHGDGARVVMGHEHPAITLDASAVSSVKCPCFLLSNQLLVMPAFSQWAAGAKVGRGRFMSALANEAPFTIAIAVVAGKLLPIDLVPIRQRQA